MLSLKHQTWVLAHNTTANQEENSEHKVCSSNLSSEGEDLYEFIL